MPRDLLAIVEPRDLLAGTLLTKGEEPRDLLTGQLPVKRETEIRALTPEMKAKYPLTAEVPEEKVFEKQVQLYTDRIFRGATGIEPEKAIEAERQLGNLMSRAPRVGLAFGAPLIALGFEAFQQAKNVIVPLVKKEKYSPLETRILSELLPEKTPTPVKVGAGVVEWLGEIALMGALADVGKRGLLSKTIKEVGTKLEAAGYGTGKVEITKEAIKEAVKGTTLEKEAARYMEAKSLEITPRPPAIPTPTTVPTVSPEIRSMALKAYTPQEFHSLPVNVQQGILNVKLEGAKGRQHAESIKGKYTIEEPTAIAKPEVTAPKDILAPAPVAEINRDIKPTPSEFKCPLTSNDTPSSVIILSTSPSPQPTKVEKPKPITTWSVVDYPDVSLINKSDPDTTRIIDSINGRIRNGMLKTVEDYKKGKNPYTLNHLIDTPIAFQKLEEKTGFPLYTKYGVQLSKARNIVAYEVATIINRFTDGLKKGYQTSLSTERIVKYIVKQEGTLTDEERKIAGKLTDIFRETKDIVSYLRMRRFIDGAEQVPKDLESIVEEGEKVFVKGGKEALEKWVKGKDIGVVTDDRYFPAQLLRKFRTHYSSDPFEVFNPHVHSRTVEEQMYDYSQSIVQKLHSYLTRMYSDYYMYDLLVDAKNDFSGTDMPYDTINSVKKWMVAIQGKGIEVGWWGQVARKARGQFFKVVLADPTKWVRNYLQRYYMTLQNYPTLQHAMRTKQYFDYKLTDSELDYFRVHISQLRELEREQLYLYEKIFEKGVLGKVDDLATSLAHRYTLVDEGNRYVTFKYALASNDKYIKLYKQGKLSLRGMLNKTGASSFYDLELKHILSLPVEEARLEIAKLLVDKTQFRYKKTERGLSALSELGEVATSLLQYPKSVITRYLDAVDMIGRGDSMEDRWAGVRLLVGLILLANVAQSVLEKIVGESRYYDPDLNREVVNDSYGLIGVIGSVQIAGAQPAHAVILARAVKRISDLLYLEASKTMPSEDYRMTAIRAILKDVDQLGEAYIPFLRIAMNGVEAVEGTRSHKLLTTYFDQKTRRQTALRRNKIQRNWVEAWSHFLFGLERKKKEAKGLWK